MAPPPPVIPGSAEHGPRGHLPIAVITGAHGVHGGLRIKLADPGSRTLKVGLKIELWGRDDHRVCTVQRVSPIPHGDRARLFVSEVRDRNTAEAMKGWEIRVRRADLPPLEEKEFYLADVMGLAVQRRHDGGVVEHLGTVVGVASNGAQDLLEVEQTAASGKRETWLLPVVPQFLLELTDEAIVVDIPEGILPEEDDGAW
jgi:16S rRNA processing protein RimM